MNIGFNKPYLSGSESKYILQALHSQKISGDGAFTQRCHRFFESRFGFAKALLTTSCTDALEMAALLLDIRPGDEVIVPSYTFVSTANAFVLRGARIVFADSNPLNPNMNADMIESLITPRTKVIVPMHYAGIACDMVSIMAVARKHNLFVIEDAAQAIDSYHDGQPLGSFGHMAAFSFHETKNITAGEGGMLVINDPAFFSRAEIIREKGTNRSAFFRGEIDKYNWVDVGSSFLPSDLTAAFLYAQLESMDDIQSRRKHVWNQYYGHLKPLAAKGYFQLPYLPVPATNNAHMFYLVCRTARERTALISHLNRAGIQAIFHYLSLHKSPFHQGRHQADELVWADHYTDCLVRLPFYCELSETQIGYVCSHINEYYAAYPNNGHLEKIFDKMSDKRQGLCHAREKTNA